MLRVVLINDDFTPMGFVMPVLKHIFDIDHDTALRLMREAHHQGRAECGIYPAAIADAKAKEVQDLARKYGHRLSCIVEPVQPD
jgi:ATP-dependent Clp protease adaptor protein ClpS